MIIFNIPTFCNTSLMAVMVSKQQQNAVRGLMGGPVMVTFNYQLWKVMQLSTFFKRLYKDTLGYVTLTAQYSAIIY